MTRDQVLAKIKEASKAIQVYNEGDLERYIGESIEQKDSEIETASIELILEARTIGAAGRACPRCGGSGRA